MHGVTMLGTLKIIDRFPSKIAHGVKQPLKVFEKSHKKQTESAL
jgi:hypothetical protein